MEWRLGKLIPRINPRTVPEQLAATSLCIAEIQRKVAVAILCLYVRSVLQ
jgi:hypothetical protein